MQKICPTCSRPVDDIVGAAQSPSASTPDAKYFCPALTVKLEFCFL